MFFAKIYNVLLNSVDKHLSGYIFFGRGLKVHPPFKGS